MEIILVVLRGRLEHKLNPIKQIAVRRSVIKTKVIERLNSTTGKNGEETCFSTLNKHIATTIAKIKLKKFKSNSCWFNKEHNQSNKYIK